MCLYFYFHLYLDNLWEELAGLPAYFPDGKRIDQRAYPWLLVTLVRKHFKRLKERPLIAKIKEWITIFLAWWVVPITMIAFWLRYIPRHDWVGTIFHVGLIVVSVAFAIYFYRLCAVTLQGKKKIEFRFLRFWGDRKFYYSVGVGVVGGLFLFLSYGAIEGVRPPLKWEEKPVNLYRIEELIPWGFKKVGYQVIADLREKSVSEKPNNYGEIAKKERLEFVIGAKLKNSDLRYADMYKAFLVKADLREAKLHNAFLENADLRKADMLHADFQKADLYHADLQDANLENANLQFVNLFKSNLQDSNLENANLQDSNLKYANFRNSNLKYADLSFAKLQYVRNLTIDQLSKVKTLYKAKLDPELLEQVKICCSHLLEKPKENSDHKEGTE